MTTTAINPWIVAVGSVLVVVVFVVGRRLLRRLGRNVENSKTWVWYLKGQGSLLFIFLAIGWIAAWAATRLGPAHGRILEHVRLIEFDSLNPADRPFREIDTDKYAAITVFAKTIAPQNGAATVTVYADRGGISSGTSEIRRLRTAADSWSRWDQRVVGQRLSFVVAPPAELNTAAASDVRILVYLSPK